MLSHFLSGLRGFVSVCFGVFVIRVTVIIVALQHGLVILLYGYVTCLPHFEHTRNVCSVYPKCCVKQSLHTPSNMSFMSFVCLHTTHIAVCDMRDVSPSGHLRHGSGSDIYIAIPLVFCFSTSVRYSNISSW